MFGPIAMKQVDPSGFCLTRIRQSNPNEPPARDITPPKKNATQEDFLMLHNGVAMQMMKNTDDLGKAFWAFSHANDLHKALTGQSSGESLYNSACCLSKAAAEQLLRARRVLPDTVSSLIDLARVPATSGAVVAPELPPSITTCRSMRDLVEARVDLAVELLRLAAGADCASCPRAAHMKQDDDLRIVRELRATAFQAVLQQAGAREPCRKQGD
jgi:hypothetical protein